MILRSAFLLYVLFTLFFSALHYRMVAQSAAILMDGRFTDWAPGLSTLVDNDAPTSGVDLLKMQVTNDADYLYIKMVLGSETDLLDNLTPQTIRLYIDGDNNAGTGLNVRSGYGAEVQIKFDTRTVTEYFGSSSTVSWSALDLVPLPTVTSDSFEIAIARNAMPDGVNSLFTSNTIKLLFTETDGGDEMPNSGSTFGYTFDETPVSPFVPITVQKDNASHLRICSWNVLGDAIIDPAYQGNYQRMLSAISPDILGLSECVSSTTTEIKTRLDSWVPIGGSGWHVVKDDYDLIVASRWPITQTWPVLSRQFPTLIDLPESYATDLLFTASHLNCCTADATRQDQVDAYVQFIQDAKTPGGSVTVAEGTLIVYSGDLNLVGYAQQLTTLLTGDIQDNGTYGPDGTMDWDGSGLADVVCPQTDARMAYTWRNNNSAYPSGRLDLFLYSDAMANIAKAYTLRTEIMPTATLTALGLQANDAGSASDHFPIIADLILPTATVELNARVFLEGPFNTTTGLMHDSLRVQGLIPLQEPYTLLGFTQANTGGGETVNAQVLTNSGPNAIVDWVLIELRDALDPSVIVATRCGLLQRDGDVVDVDGSSGLRFQIDQGSYHVAMRHRNHLGVMTANAISFGSTPVQVDLTDPTTPTFGAAARKTIGAYSTLWTGNAVRNDKLQYTGQNNDRDQILNVIGGVVPTNVVHGYRAEDTNLDGIVRYTGTGNDRDLILSNIGGVVPTNSRVEQLP